MQLMIRMQLFVSQAVTSLSEISEAEVSSGPSSSSSTAAAASAPSSNDGPLLQVPWGLGKVIQVMLLWLLAYILMGQVAVPAALSLLGIDRDYMGVRGHAVLHLCLDL